MAEKTADDIIKQIKDEDVEYVDIRFCDLPGIVQHFSVPASVFDESVFEDGLAFDGSSVRGFQSIHESDMMLLPDPETARIDPFRAAKTLNLNFFVHDPFTREAYSRDPRNVARKAENYLTSTGIADTAYFGAEAEFYIFDSVSLRLEDQRHVLRDRLRGRLVEHRRAGRGRRQRQPRLQGPPEGRLLPRRPVRPLRRPARRRCAPTCRTPASTLETRPPRGRHRRARPRSTTSSTPCCTRPTTCCCSNTSSRTRRGRPARP